MRVATPWFALVMAGALAASCSGQKVTPAQARQQAFADLRADMSAVVTDPQRLAQSLTLVEQVEQRFNRIGETRASIHARFRALNRDYDARRDDFGALLVEFEQRARHNLRHVAQLRDEFVGATTEEEWQALSKSRSKAMHSAIEAIQSQ